MRPIDRVRADPDEVRRAVRARGYEKPSVDRIIELDEDVRRLKAEAESLRAERNKASRVPPGGSKAGPPSEDIKQRMREVGQRVGAIEAELVPLESELDEQLLWIPNVIDPAVP